MKFQCNECKVGPPYTMVKIENAAEGAPNLRCENCGFEARGFVVTDGPGSKPIHIDDTR